MESKLIQYKFYSNYKMLKTNAKVVKLETSFTAFFMIQTDLHLIVNILVLIFLLDKVTDNIV